MNDGLPTEVRRFLGEHIRSVEALGVLLLLFADPMRAWTAGEVGREARTNEWSAQLHLDELSRHGLIRPLGGSRAGYRAVPTVARVVAAVARALKEHRIAVIRYISSRPDDEEPPPAAA